MLQARRIIGRPMKSMLPGEVDTARRIVADLKDPRSVHRGIVGGVESERNLALLENLCDTLLQGSLCGLGGMTPFPVQSAIKHFREDFRARSQTPLKRAG
jgi:hypothetical protein